MRIFGWVLLLSPGTITMLLIRYTSTHTHTHTIFFKSEWNSVIGSDVDGPKVCHSEWSKSKREKQTRLLKHMLALPGDSSKELTYQPLRGAHPLSPLFFPPSHIVPGLMGVPLVSLVVREQCLIGAKLWADVNSVFSYSNTLTPSQLPCALNQIKRQRDLSKATRLLTNYFIGRTRTCVSRLSTQGCFP